jgi:hypothetical protein
MHKSVFFFAAPIALVIACSTSNNSNPSPDAACASLASALCKRISDCSSFAVTSDYGDEATCETREKISCLATLNAPSTSETASLAQSCAGAVPSLACADLVNHKIPDGCKSGPGALADGAACGDDSQCKGERCRIPTGQSCGVCSTIAAAGTACTTTSNCDYGLVCANSLCVAPGAGGATCDAGHPCGGGFACLNGTCSAVLAAGATCDATAQNCDPLAGLICLPSTKVCATITFAAAGGACGLTSSGYVACSGKGFCKRAATSQTGTCVAAAADGQPCDDNNGPNCVSPAVCTNGACKLPDSSACK